MPPPGGGIAEAAPRDPRIESANMMKLLAVLFALLWLLIPSNGIALAADDVEVATAGRLGGTLQTFIDRFGDPVEINQSAGPIFVTEEFGYLSVQVDRIQGTHGLEDRARVITVSPPRPSELAADEPSDVDWSVDSATEHVRSLLPTDVVLNPADSHESGQLAFDCQSEALTEVFGAVSLGQCRVSMVMPTPDTVSFATIAMTAGAATTVEADDSPDGCEGAFAWIRTSGATLESIDEMLGKVASIVETDPDSATLVRELSSGFQELATEVRDNDPPAELSEASFYLVSGLTSYAEGFEIAASAIESGDAAAADQAVDALESAGKAVNNAIEAIGLASETCGLRLGTPIATDG